MKSWKTMKSKKIRVVFGIIVLFICGGMIYLVSRRDDSATTIPQYVFTYAENQPEDYPTTQGAYHFAGLVEERTNGRIKINVHAGAKLGDEVSVIEQVQFGGIDFARASIMTMSETVPALNVLQLPYLYDTSEKMWNILDGEIGQEFMSYLDDYGMKALSWYDAGARHFYTSKKEITRLEDLAGLRIRVADSELMYDLVTALGAIPVRLPYSEVYSALETSQIDGAENNCSSYEKMGHYTVAKYITLDGHNQIPELQVVSSATWNKLSKEDQNIILECAIESAKYQRLLWTKQEDASKTTIVGAGCIVTELTGSEIKKIKEALMPLYDKFGGEYANLIQRIKDAQVD